MLRIYSKHIEEYLKYFPCVVISGARQCGKTTILNEIAKDWKRYDLERRSDYDIIASNPDLFLESNPTNIAIDEVQLLPEIFPALRVAIDNDRSRKGRYILTGSSSPDMIKSVSESLAGRSAKIEMSPLSFEETGGDFSNPLYEAIRAGKGIEDAALSLKKRRPISEIMRYWLEGGYPEPWVSADPTFHRLWMEEYEKSYIERDITRLFRGLNIDKYRLFIKMMSSLSGSIINYSDIARALGVSAPTISDYFSIAEGTFIWRRIPSFEKNAVKRVSRHPKGYLRDCGLLNHFLRIRSSDDLLANPRLGYIWEGMIIEEIIRALSARGTDFRYYYYHTSGGAEIDLILEGDFGLIPIEIKFHQSVTGHELRSMETFLKEKKLPFGLVFNNSTRPEKLRDNIIGIPFGML